MPRGGQPHTEATKQLLRRQKLGKPLSRKHAAAIGDALRGKPKTKQHRARIAAALRRNKHRKFKTFREHWNCLEGMVYILGVEGDPRIKLGFTAQPLAARLSQIKSRGYKDWLPKGTLPTLLYHTTCLYPCRVEKTALRALKAEHNTELVRANLVVAQLAIEQAAQEIACSI